MPSGFRGSRSRKSSVYRVDFLSAARKDLRRIKGPIRGRIIEAIDSLCSNPRPPGCRKLERQPFWRIRVQDYRVLYQILDDSLVITVIRVRHRRDVYR